ncbi:hypothetical protein Sa4125_42830 [Aureimonas sp. SA4125]|uniref:sulfate adenylyltransferase subunit CysN n=1 Tax=Aureimonas sp. SA4125 TaxID=2826993 RepID=UPI001CC57BC4|nr:sulfate adenylyltransferase subunit CysN [Aureimonas sp. SA4125]BDA86741.1 hypothetical protein Sa4125_42830 [Aureimonas sp. SA4125]
MDSLARIADAEFAGPAPDSVAIPAPAESLLRFITCGSVDDGKSTLIGRLLYDANAVFDDQLEALKRDSKKFGTTGDDLDFALLVDGLSAEREQGITIDVAYRYFSTPKRAFIIADTPGHEQYTRNMATGASSAELAVILVDARKGILPQTRRHSFITSMLGVKSVIIAINKMDLVGFDQAVFDRIVAAYKEILPALGFTDVSYIPLSAKNGDNITSRSPHTPWYSGETLLERLESATPATFEADGASFRMPVQWVNRPNLDFRGYCGTIAGGRVAKGDPVTALPNGGTSRIKAVYGPGGEVMSAGTGEAITVTLEDEVDLSRGDVLVVSGDPVAAHKSVKAEILWMVDRPLISGGRFVARIGTAQTPATVKSLDKAIDIHSYEPRDANALLMNEIGRVTVVFDRPPVTVPYQENRDLGAFILIDQLTNETVALGLVRAVGADAPRFETAAPLAEPTASERAKRAWFGADVAMHPERASGVLRFRALAAVLIALLALALGLGWFAAAVLGLADFALRPLLRQAVGGTEPGPGAASDPTTVRDGAGI